LPEKVILPTCGATKNWPLIEKELFWHLTAGENLAMQSRQILEGLNMKLILEECKGSVGPVNKLNRFPQPCWGEPKICAMNL